MCKVYVNINVANALENVLEIYGKEDAFLLIHKQQFPKNDLYYSFTTLYELAESKGYLFLAKAIEDGYEIEKSPEESLLDYYLDLKKSEIILEDNNQGGSQFRQGWQSVEKTLEILNLQIEGINC